jgi:hypothetical protein
VCFAGERHGTPAERLLAAQRRANQAEKSRPHTLFATGPKQQPQHIPEGQQGGFGGEEEEASSQPHPGFQTLGERCAKAYYCTAKETLGSGVLGTAQQGAEGEVHSV